MTTIQYTKRQHELMQYLGWYVARYGYSPTLGEIAEYLHISTPTVHEHVTSLCRKRALRRVATDASRNLEVLDETFLKSDGPTSDSAARKWKLRAELWKRECEGLLPQHSRSLLKHEMMLIERRIAEKVHGILQKEVL